MTFSRSTRNLLRVAVAAGLAFIYIPLFVIAIYAFNGGTSLKWPPPSLTTHWFGQAIDNPGARHALLTSVEVGLVATAVALVLGTLASFAVSRYSFFGRETVSFLVIIPIALPGIVTGLALSNTFTQVLGVQLSLLTVIAGHATFCIVVVYNNVIARLRRISGNMEEASADLGAHTWQTFRHITLPNMLHLELLRSPVAHARIKSIDTSRASALPGVVAVVTGELMAQHNLAWMPTLSGDTQAVLATDKVRFQGQEVAAVIAEDPYIAKDAVELIDVDYDALGVVVSPQQALASDAPVIRDEKEGQSDNHIYHWESGDAEATDRAFAQADRVVSLDTFYPRSHPAPLETCGCIADVNSATGQTTIYMTSQAPHAHRTVFALVGGIWFIWILGYNWSVAVAIGSVVHERGAGPQSRTKRSRSSPTQQGLSLPSSSNTSANAAWTPPATCSSELSSTPRRTREPTGTGAGKRTLSSP